MEGKVYNAVVMEMCTEYIGMDGSLIKRVCKWK